MGYTLVYDHYISTTRRLTFKKMITGPNTAAVHYKAKYFNKGCWERAGRSRRKWCRGRSVSGWATREENREEKNISLRSSRTFYDYVVWYRFWSGRPRGKARRPQQAQRKEQTLFTKWSSTGCYLYFCLITINISLMPFRQSADVFM